MRIRTLLLAVAATLCGLAHAAGEADGTDQVAAGFRAWNGLVEKNHIAGRAAEPSDFRHRVVVVIEVDGADFVRQMTDTAWGTVGADYAIAPLKGGSHWEDGEMSRDCAVLYIIRGTRPKGDFNAQLCQSKDARGILRAESPVYENVTFSDAVDSTGKLPFVTIFGPTEKEPIMACQQTPKTMRQIYMTVLAAQKKVPEWDKLSGYAGPLKFYPQLAKAYEAGKPLKPIEQLAKKGVSSSNPERARESQFVYDALVQMRNVLKTRIRQEKGHSPPCTVCDIERLVRGWPNEKKTFAELYGGLMKDPNAVTLTKAYKRVKELQSPSFRVKGPGEAKKIVAELTKFREQLAPIKEVRSIQTQNSATFVDLMLEQLVSSVPEQAKK